MSNHELSYGCSVCRWQGRLEPVDTGNAAPCPNCGVYLYPDSWLQTWGMALILIGMTLGAVFVASFAKI